MSSAIAAPALAGIPVTHRGVSSAFLVVSGHDEEVFASAVGALQPNGVTLVVLMGVARSAAIATLLIERGWSPETPAAIVVDASTAESAGVARNARWSSRRVRPVLEVVKRVLVPCSGPVTIIVGDVVALAPAMQTVKIDQAVRNPDRGNMSLAHEEKTFGRARLSFANEAEIDEFVATLEKYERGEITPDQWRVYRLVRGTYGQRQAEDAQMLRIKIPQGLLTADHLDVLAEIGERYSRGFGHITTRQNIQFHFVKLHDVEPAMRLLADAGHHDARGVREFREEHHRVPVRRRRGRRTVRRHAVRRGADAVSAAAADQLDASAQIQDRVRRMPGRSRPGRDQRPGVLCARSVPTAAAASA